ncbi:MAG TPA: hypothetical protein VL574_03000, partial [Stellaceae bacterium]|nr:hypothetical protein [Stellaceae bacterium]
MALLVAAVIGGGWLWLGSDDGRFFLAEKLAQALSQPGHPAQVEGLTGQPPFHLRLAHLIVPDSQGDWLSIDNAVLDIDGKALLRRTLRIERLTADSITVDRAPISQPSAAKPSPTSFSLPRLPVALELDNLDIAKINLAPAVLGQGVTAYLSARASLHEGRANAHVDLHRTDGTGGQLRLDLSYSPDDRLTLALHAAEPTGLLLAALDPIAGKRPLTLDLAGAGTLSDWSGDLKLTGGKDVRVDSGVLIGRQRAGLMIKAGGEARIQPLLPVNMRGAAGLAVPFAIGVGIEDGKPLRLDHLRLHMAAVDVEAG